ncbi:hypothetical protein CC79DRAFT_1341291 [Sarocladium strictum]
MKLFAAATCLAGVAEAHTLFTTLHIDGNNQGDGTCVRQPEDPGTATAPIYPLNGDNMACGRQGEKSVPFVCPAKGGSTLTFEFREWPAADQPGSINKGHKGPCNVYMKKMNDVLTDPAAGDGWFKIWEDGYNVKADEWCVDTLIKNNGLLSVDLPTGLPPGEYLIRPELIALHNTTKGNPQFYHSCAQIFIDNGPDTELEIPAEFEVSIPGYLSTDDPGLTYNLYRDELSAYSIQGPPVFVPTLAEGASSVTKKQEHGAIPNTCLVKNANWCAMPIKSFSDEEGCWNGVTACWNQGDECWDSVPPSGYANCEVWSTYCKSMEKAFKGDDEAGQTPGTESPALKISEDGRCGGSTGQTCQGSSFGDCCSKKGRCGRKTKHCACGCQSDFGDCRA